MAFEQPNLNLTPEKPNLSLIYRYNNELNQLLSYQADPDKDNTTMKRELNGLVNGLFKNIGNLDSLSIKLRDLGFTEGGGNRFKPLRAKTFIRLIAFDDQPLMLALENDMLDSMALKKLIYIISNAFGNDSLVKSIVGTAKILEPTGHRLDVDKRLRDELILSTGLVLAKIKRQGLSQQEFLQILMDASNVASSGKAKLLAPVSTQSGTSSASTGSFRRDLVTINTQEFLSSGGISSMQVPPRSSTQLFDETFINTRGSPPTSIGATSYRSAGSGSQYYGPGMSFSSADSARSHAFVGMPPTVRETDILFAASSFGSNSHRSGIGEPQSASVSGSVNGNGGPPSVNNVPLSSGPGNTLTQALLATLAGKNEKDNYDQELSRLLLQKTPYTYDKSLIPDSLYEDLVETRARAYFAVNVTQLEQDRNNRIAQEIQNRITLQEEFNLDYKTPLCPENHGPKSYVR